MEHPARTLPKVTTKEPPPDPFFLRTRLGCFLFLIVLFAVVVGTAFHYVVQATASTATVAGSTGPLEQSIQNPLEATYGFTVEDDEMRFLRVRNHGRILAYLQRTEGEREVTVRSRRGQAVSLTVRESGLEIREAQAPPFLLLAVALLSATIFIALLLPVSGLREVIGWQATEGAAQKAGLTSAEEE